MADTMPKSPEGASKQMSGTMRYAGFWIRFLASIIDGIIIGVIGAVIFPGSASYSDGMVKVTQNGPQTLLSLVFTIGFWLWLSATPGKLILGLKIVEENGAKLSVKGAILRYIGYIVSGIVIGLGFLWIGFDKEKQGWHDKIAKTHVIHTR